MLYPKFYNISSGRGVSSYKLVSFDNALINAGISNYNLLKVSSILPIGCIEKKRVDLQEGSLLYTAYGSISSSHAGEVIATAVGIGIPADKGKIGIIMEFEGKTDAKNAEIIVRKMIEESMNEHGIKIGDVRVSSIDGVAPDEGYLSLVSAVSMW